MTVYVADAHALAQGLVLVVKLETVHEECTTEEQRSAVLFFVGKKLNANDIHKEKFPVYGGKCLSRKAFTTGSRNYLKDVRKSQMMPNQLRKWLRQQSNGL
jgi:hypothetical protein